MRRCLRARSTHPMVRAVATDLPLAGPRTGVVLAVLATAAVVVVVVTQVVKVTINGVAIAPLVVMVRVGRTGSRSKLLEERSSSCSSTCRRNACSTDDLVAATAAPMRTSTPDLCRSRSLTPTCGRPRWSPAAETRSFCPPHLLTRRPSAPPTPPLHTEARTPTTTATSVVVVWALLLPLLCRSRSRMEGLLRVTAVQPAVEAAGAGRVPHIASAVLLTRPSRSHHSSSSSSTCRRRPLVWQSGRPARRHPQQLRANREEVQRPPLPRRPLHHSSSSSSSK